jgi:hypothetical protein
MSENDVFTMYMTKHMGDSNLGVQSIYCVIRVYIDAAVYYSARACTPRVVLEKGTFYPNPLIRRFMDVYIN